MNKKISKIEKNPILDMNDSTISMTNLQSWVSTRLATRW